MMAIYSVPRLWNILCVKFGHGSAARCEAGASERSEPQERSKRASEGREVDEGGSWGEALRVDRSSLEIGQDCCLECSGHTSTR